MAFARLLIAHLSRFQACSLFAELMKHFGCPAKTPRLNDPSTLPMQRIGDYKAGDIGQIRPFMDDGNPFTPVTLEADTFGKGPILFRLPIATADLNSAKTLRRGLTQGRGHFIKALPPILPQNMARTLQFTHPMFAFAFNEPRQLKGEHAIIKRIVSLGKASFLL